MAPARSHVHLQQIAQPWSGPTIKIDPGLCSVLCMCTHRAGGRSIWVSLSPMAETLKKC
uniref:Uncharacterized protein n=1 Tax=Anguilla anguilla TaxID=7936 RepID=A0A0E9W110_ANGAN